MHSCIYQGTVRHRRRVPVTHEFQYRVFMILLDLAELPSLVGRGSLISDRRFGIRSFLRTDHLFDSSTALDSEARSLVRERTGKLPTGPIRLLTQLRCLGTYFSPLNLYFYFDDQDQRVEFITAEVNNTPWNERHCYVLWDGNRRQDSSSLVFSHPKEFHVSPFMDMQMHYEWRFNKTEENLDVQLANSTDRGPIFEAQMRLQRYALTSKLLRQMTLRYPLMGVKVTAAIYYQALKLWWKKCPFYTHPNKRSDARPATLDKPLELKTAAKSVLPKEDHGCRT